MLLQLPLLMLLLQHLLTRSNLVSISKQKSRLRVGFFVA
jgi:hypothetical protein